MLPAYRWDFNKDTPFFIPELITRFREADTSGIIGILNCTQERLNIDKILSQMYNCFKEYNRIAGSVWGDSQYKKDIQACNDGLPANYKFIACCSGFAALLTNSSDSSPCVDAERFDDCNTNGNGSTVVRSDPKYIKALQTYFACVTKARDNYLKRDPKKSFDVRVPSGGLCDFNKMNSELNSAYAAFTKCITGTKIDLGLPLDQQ